MRSALYNGKFYLSRGQFAEAVLIENGRILEVGSSQAIRSAEDITERIDCQGHTVLPGLNDSHMHLLMIGENMNRLMLSSHHSIAELIQAGRDWIAAHPARCAHGLYARGWNEDLFTSGEQRVLNRHDLDQVSTEIPVIYERICGHILVTNTKAIEMLGLSGSTAQYDGGVYEIGEDSYPNGIFAENACSHPIALIPYDTVEQQKENLLSAMHYAVSKGLTSVQSNDLSYYTRDKQETAGILQSVYSEGNGLLRYHFQVCPESPEQLRDCMRSGILSRQARERDDNMLTSGALKLFKDGSLGARTAMIRNSYSDDPGNSGVVTTPMKLFDEYCAIAAENGVQVVTHVIGDGAIEEVLDSYAKVLVNGKNPQRHSLIHCQITDRALLERIIQMGVYVQYQPIFLNYDIRIADQRVGRELASTSYAFGSLAAAGAHISFGTDSPVEDLDPFDNIYSAVTRRTLDGTPSDGWNTQECMDVSSAIDAYTVGSAEVQFMEDRKGRIAPGYFADLTVLDRDIFSIPPDEIKDIQAVRTIVNGKTVFEKGN